MFNKKDFMNTELVPRTKTVKVEELKDWFEGEPNWVVKSLSHRQLATAEEHAKGDSLNILIAALSGNNKEQADAIRKLVGLDKGVPEDTAKRMEYLTIGSVDPEIELEVAVKIATDFPAVFVLLSNEIIRLTGLGSEAKVKLDTSGKE